MGSNIEPRLEYLKQAALGLKQPPLKLVQVSGVYETEPQEHKDQPSFLNVIAVVETTLPAEELLEKLKALEREAKRESAFRFGPRTLDLDLVLFGMEIRNTAGLKLPHPRMDQRAFVLLPMCEVNPGIRHPVKGRTVGELLFNLPGPRQKVEWWGELGVAAE
jgi:2-amino-4-hydroxy-6-hydroxymethyldihydropteridine diphosphokinase